MPAMNRALGAGFSLDGKSVFEVDRELIDGFAPALGRSCPALLCREHREVDQLEGRFVVGEVSLAVDELADTRVEGLDRVGRVQDAA